MPQPNFGADRTAYILLPCYDRRSYKLFKSTWDLKIKHDERRHLEFNYDKIKETFLKPDLVRESQNDPRCFIAYKKIPQYTLIPGRPKELVFETFLAVVADGANLIIKTFYPCEKTKPGKHLWP